MSARAQASFASTVTRFVTLADYQIVVVTVQFTDGRVFEGSSEVTRGSGGGGFIKHLPVPYLSGREFRQTKFRIGHGDRSDPAVV